MERGIAITLIIIAMVLVLGVLAFVFLNYAHVNGDYDVKEGRDRGDDSYTISKTTTYSRSSGTDAAVGSDNANAGTQVILVDNAGNTVNNPAPANTNYGYGNNQVYGMNYGMMGYVNTNAYPTDYYGNRVLMDRYANRVYGNNDYYYYYDGYRDGEFRCVDYYDRGDGITRNHCSRIVDDDYRYHHDYNDD